MKIKTDKKGFTLIELIVYVGVSSIMLVIAINMTSNLIVSNASARGKQEVYINARLAMNQLQLKIREAEDVIIGSSTFNSHPGILTLDYPGSDTDVIFDTYTKNVDIGGQTVEIRKLRIKEGTADYVDLTSDKVDLTNLVFTNLTRGSESKNTNIEITLEKINPGSDPDYDASISVETAISIRE